MSRNPDASSRLPGGLRLAVAVGLGLLLPTPAAAGAADTMAVQPDGRVVAVGYAAPESAAIVRYNPDGSLDGSFGRGGIVIERRLYRLSAVALQPDGKIVVVAVGGGVELARFLPDGRPDPSFGEGGVAGPASSSPSARFRPSAVLIRPDGSIVVGGTFSSKHHPPFAYANLYNPDGSFSGRIGKVPSQSEMSDLLEEPDGSLIMVGNASGESAALLARFVPGSGSWYDTSFGAGEGLVKPALFPGDQYFDRTANAVVGDAGKLVVAGSAAGRPLLMRLDGRGVLDTSFGEGGIASPTISGSALSVANAVMAQPDGMLVVAGTSYSSLEPTSGFNNPCRGCGVPMLARFAPDGSLDAGFGGQGFVHLTTPSGGSYFATGEDLAVLPDGRVLIAGTSAGARGSFVLARYGADGNLDLSFGQGGVVTTLPCPGGEARRRKTRCLPSAQVRLRLSGGSSPAPAVHLHMRPNLSWARIESVQLTLPSVLRVDPGLSGRAKAFAVDGAGRRVRVRPRGSSRRVAFNAPGYARALHATLGNGFLKASGPSQAGRRLAFRLKFTFRDRYRDEGKQTLVLRLAG